jgi:NADPH:quinone reductase-like Zn-dependent oxidoreductase
MASVKGMRRIDRRPYHVTHAQRDMRAAICTRYGPPDVLQIQEVDVPDVGKRDVLIRIRATTVTASDCFVRSAIPNGRLVMRIMLRLVIGMTRPRRAIQGAVLAGEIEATGKNVTRFRVGDRVWAFTLLRFGCYAQRTCLPATFRLLAAAPSNVTHDEAAAIPYGGLLASRFLRRANIQPGQQVLVYGASGAIGTCGVQLAKHLGANVTAVCSTANLELVRSLGADAVLDYTKDNLPAGRRYDVAFDAVGRRKTSPLKVACVNALTPGGRSISVDDRTPRVRGDDLIHLKELVETGKLKPIIDRRYPLEQIAEAHRYVEQGHKKGNVVITVAD